MHAPKAHHRVNHMGDNKNQSRHAGAGSDGPDARADEPKTCTNCGARINTTEWHPVTAETDADGNFRVYAFCDEGCRDEWGDTGDGSTDRQP